MAGHETRSTSASGRPLRLVVEGWRHIHHSYALVAQSHCLCLLRRPGIALRFVDLPYFSAGWQRTSGLFAPQEEAALAGIPAPEPGFAAGATLDMQPERPDFAPPATGLKYVFGTPEYRVLREENVAPLRSARELPDSLRIVTPSRWTAIAYERFGFAPERIHVVPHGIDPALMRPEEGEREAMRAKLGLAGHFVFMSLGAMTGNKGIDVLLRAFAAVAEVVPEARLVLKGADALYGSRDFLRGILGSLPVAARERVVSRLMYHGGTLSSGAMAAFLRAADCYVAPYRAEGFNMPALEASACGVASILTGGGPTDDFTDPAFAARIRSRTVRQPLDARQTGEALEPDPVHLTELMLEAARDPQRTRERGQLASRHAHAHYTWERVTDVLLDAFCEAPR